MPYNKRNIRQIACINCCLHINWQMQAVRCRSVGLSLEKYLIHPLLPISLSETADESFITYSVGPSIRTLTDNLCLQAGFAPNILLECETPSNYRNFIQSGLAVCLLPYQTQYSLFSSDLIPIHLNDPVCKRKLFLSHPKGKYLNTAMVIFQKFCLEYFKKLN